MSEAAQTTQQREMPKEFIFSEENKARIEVILKRYPEERKASAVMPVLDLAQRQCGGWLPQPALDAVAEIVGLSPIRVYEVASFYTMYNLKPVGKHLVQICRTTPCWLRGSDDITKSCKDNLGIGMGETTEDGLFSLMEVECLGACANAPMVQINDDYYEDLDADSMHALLNDLRDGRDVKKGSQKGRICSAPSDGVTTLTDLNGEG